MSELSGVGSSPGPVPPAPISPGSSATGTPAGRDKGWTAALRGRLDGRLPLEEVLPTRQPAFVGSWVYVFGVVTIAALVWVLVSGCVLAFMGSESAEVGTPEDQADAAEEAAEEPMADMSYAAAAPTTSSGETMKRETDYGYAIKPVYTPADIEGMD